MKGSILKAMDGDLDSAKRGRQMAADLITRSDSKVMTPIATEWTREFAFDFDSYLGDDYSDVAPAA
jgi:hypothetical protein